LSADRSAADNFPARALWALRAAADTVRIATGPTVQLGFGGRQIFDRPRVDGNLYPCQGTAVPLPRTLEHIEAELATGGTGGGVAYYIALKFFERRDLFLVSRESGMAFP
jgi:hypothetical protein